jgi:hypothetical protein
VGNHDETKEILGVTVRAPLPLVERD